MIIGDRMRKRMDELGISQAELARRIGISQPSIYRIVHGEVAGSKHIHRIARELLTTPAYLTGETDDLEADAPPAPDFTPDERAWVDYWRALDRDGREICVRVVQKFLCGHVPEQAAKILKHI